MYHIGMSIDESHRRARAAKNMFIIFLIFICMYIYPLYNSHLYQSYFEREREPTMLSVIKFHSSSSFN